MSASVSDAYGSAHDPLCFVNNLCVECHCDLIAKVREDERCKAELHNYHMPAWTSGYLDALDAAEKAVADIDGEEMCCACNDDYRMTIAAIRALKEKP